MLLHLGFLFAWQRLWRVLRGVAWWLASTEGLVKLYIEMLATVADHYMLGVTEPGVVTDQRLQ